MNESRLFNMNYICTEILDFRKAAKQGVTNGASQTTRKAV